jgi:hypothetical protein
LFFVKNKGHREHAEFGRLRDARFLGRPKEKKQKKKKKKEEEERRKKKKKEKEKDKKNLITV